MALQKEIREELQLATKDRDQVKMDTLRAVIAASMNEAVSLGKTPQDELPDESVLAVIKKLIKQRKDSIEQFKAGGREDLIDAEQNQLLLLEKYLPAQMSEENIKEIAMRKKEEMGLVDKAKAGILVGAVMKETAGQADGLVVKRVVENLFN